MAAVPSENSEPLKYMTWVLRVSIHCEGCKRKVKRILHSVEGVYTIDVDTRQHKVVVTGNVDANTLLRKLEKSGKHAELWPNIQQFTNQVEQQQEVHEQQQQHQHQHVQEQQNSSNNNTEPHQGAENNNTTNNSAQQPPPPQVKEVRFEGNVPATGDSQKPPGNNPGSGGGGGKKKKKKKGHGNNTSNNNGGNGNGNSNGNSNGNGGNGEGAGNVPEQGDNGGPPCCESHPPSNPPQHPSPETMSPPCQYPPNCRVYEYPPTYYAPPPQPAYAVSYNTAYPSSAYTASYYSAPPPYSYAYVHQGSEVEPPAPLDWNPNVAPPSDTFEVFSDENPNACSVM